MTTTRDESSGARPVLALRGMTKRFVDVVACDDVDLTLHPGEIHGILGENGAGKSTLMRMAMGLVIPDAGTIEIDGVPCRFDDPGDAVKRGLGMVHQQYSLVDALTVWENVALGEHDALDRDATRDRVETISARYGLPVDVDAFVRDLPAGSRQRVEIIKCLQHEPRILILDEPTAALTPDQSEQLFAVLRAGVRREGWAVALVSHKLDEILRTSDRITIMRDGKVVERVRTAETDAWSLAHAMVGRDVALRSEAFAVGASVDTPGVVRGHGEEGPAILEISDATAAAADGAVVLDGLSLSVRSGEIVGIAGVEGNGQTALADTLSSLLRLDRGTIRVDGTTVPTGKAGAMHRAGVTVIPADRQYSGCVPDMSVAENLVLADIENLSRRGVLQRRAIRARAAALIEEFGIHAARTDMPFAQLSGGNQQRAVLAHALSISPKVLVAHQPTRGLDVGAIEYTGDRLRAAADDGVGVLLISGDLDEIAALADRILVISRGRIVGEVDRANLDPRQLGLLMGGATAQDVAT
jgi:simple sugar transport system ATP-binding protein